MPYSEARLLLRKAELLCCWIEAVIAVESVPSSAMHRTARAAAYRESALLLERLRSVFGPID